MTRTNLRDSNMPTNATTPFSIKQQDVAQEQQRHAAIWSKILPFVLFIWALTGAFYPAIDLCAGEKERGTLETLLVSPAKRREIVWGKLLTIMTFSVITALLNLASLGLTAKFILAQFREIISMPGASALTMPPLASLLWLVLALLPIAAFFSAMCLACAAFARSTKEGQYYLMPLLLIIMPLMMLPLSPGVELTLGNSLIPVTGVVLLLRSVIEGQYWQALPYLLPVGVVTLSCCLLAIRWAEDQFNRESVLFSESERLDLGRWLTHLFRDRADTPTLAQAILCIVVVSIVQFFVSLSLSARQGMGSDFHSFAQLMFISQVVCIALPAGLMTLLFTSPCANFVIGSLAAILTRIGCGRLGDINISSRQPICPVGRKLYPYSPEVKEQIAALSGTLQQAPNWWLPLVLMGLLPALCEEIAFRGFILSGLRHLGHKWWAIGISAIAFGMAHFILQQKVSAAAVGLVIGVLAVQTGNLVPCMVFHALYNSLTILTAHFAERIDASLITHPALKLILRTDGNGFLQDWVMIACLCGAVLSFGGSTVCPIAGLMKNNSRNDSTNSLPVLEHCDSNRHNRFSCTFLVSRNATMSTFSLRARWVLPHAGPALQEGVVSINGGKIISVQQDTSSIRDMLDLGDVILLPGLVNAHTHLEFSDVAKPLGQSGVPVPEWIRLVIGTRKHTSRDSAQAIKKGLEESHAAGVTTIAEIATTSASCYADFHGANLVAFQEVIGFSAGRTTSVLNDLTQRLDSASMHSTTCSLGISPHAPYTVHPNLLRQLVERARDRNLPVAMHLAESPEELELLASGSGPFQVLLEERGMWDSEAISHGSTCLDYLRILAEAPRSLVIHGNYLNEQEIEFLAEHRSHMSVVYCPRTHAYFDHDPYPLERMLASGVRVAVGTDSRASNPDLNLLSELRGLLSNFLQYRRKRSFS